MSDHLPDSERKEYLTLIIGYLMEQYVHSRDPETKAEIDRLRAEIAELTKPRNDSR